MRRFALCACCALVALVLVANVPKDDEPTQLIALEPVDGLTFLESAWNTPATVWSNVTTRTRRKLLGFDGSPTPTAMLEGGNALRDFTLSLWLKSRRGCVDEGPLSKPHRMTVTYDSYGQWYVAGCALASSVHSVTPPPTWRPEWRARRACCPVEPLVDLHSPAGLSDEAVAARQRVRSLLWNGARSDFGLALLPSGDGLAFGVGHRDFVYRAKSGRPVRDTTLVANLSSRAGLLDGEWHHIAAVRRSTGDLALYVDGKRLKHAAVRIDGATVGARAATAARRAALEAADDRPHELHDASNFVTLGQLYRGCLFDVALYRRALSVEEIRRQYASHGTPSIDEDACARASLDDEPVVDVGLRPASVPTRRIPLYFVAHTDNGSIAMRDAFLQSLRDDRFEPRQVTVDARQTTQKDRYGPKGAMILRALAENPPDSLVLIADIDIRVFRPLYSIIQIYAMMRDADVVFQRDEDWTLAANLGFIALRCRPNVTTFFQTVTRLATQYARGVPMHDAPIKGGDQRIVNAVLRDPSRVPAWPRLKWALFPPNLMTRSIELQRGLMYRHDATSVLYHINEFGNDRTSPDKARSSKVALLDAAERRRRDAMQVYRRPS